MSSILDPNRAVKKPFTAGSKNLVEVKLPNNWRPREDQLKFWRYMQGGGKRATEVAHRRWGKDDVSLHWTACSAFQKVGNYWHMLPEYSQGRKAIWEAVNPRTGLRRIDEAFPRSIRAATKTHEMMIKFINGSTWQVVGSDNYNSLMGSPPVGVVFSEYALADPMAWAYLRPILAENGGWAIFIYTPRGENHGWRMYNYALDAPDWFAELLTVDDTPVFTPEIIANEKLELINEYGESEGMRLFLQEYYCSFKGFIQGAYYAKQITDAYESSRITAVPYATGNEVYTFWDLGMDDSTTIWFMQHIGMQYRFIDYYENSGEGLSHYAKVLKEKPYIYGDHYLPHDVEVRELGTGVSRRETAEDLGLKSILTVKRARNMDAVKTGIEAARNILSQCWFDKEKCQRGLQALQGYRAAYDKDRKVLQNVPEHSWHSHGADAFRTFAVGYAPPMIRKSVLSTMNEYYNRNQSGAAGWMG